jgi:hypothetical protein
MISSFGNVLKGIRTAAVATALFAAASANAATIFVTPSGSSGVDGPVSARAEFTLGAGHLSLTIFNLLDNPTAAGQLLSGIKFDLSGASGSGALTTVNSGLISNISAGGAYTAGAADPLTRWHATESGTNVNLTTLTGGKPNRLIIGPDDAGKFDTTGKYSDANASILQHLPVVLGSATFEINIPGITALSDITNVIFNFGTAVGEVTAPGVPPEGGPTIPEPTVASLFGLGALALGMARRRRA